MSKNKKAYLKSYYEKNKKKLNKNRAENWRKLKGDAERIGDKVDNFILCAF